MSGKHQIRIIQTLLFFQNLSRFGVFLVVDQQFRQQIVRQRFFAQQSGIRFIAGMKFAEQGGCLFLFTGTDQTFCLHAQTIGLPAQQFVFGGGFMVKRGGGFPLLFLEFQVGFRYRRRLGYTRITVMSFRNTVLYFAVLGKIFQIAVRTEFDLRRRNGSSIRRDNPGIAGSQKRQNTSGGKQKSIQQKFHMDTSHSSDLRASSTAQPERELSRAPMTSTTSPFRASRRTSSKAAARSGNDS